MVKDFVGNLWEMDNLLPHWEDDNHIDCAYCYRTEHGEFPPVMPANVCSVHLAWLEARYRELLIERKREER